MNNLALNHPKFQRTKERILLEVAQMDDRINSLAYAKVRKDQPYAFLDPNILMSTLSQAADHIRVSYIKRQFRRHGLLSKVWEN